MAVADLCVRLSVFNKAEGKGGVLKESYAFGNSDKMFVEKMGKWEAMKFKSVSKGISQSTFIY